MVFVSKPRSTRHLIPRTQTQLRPYTKSTNTEVPFAVRLSSLFRISALPFGGLQQQQLAVCGLHLHSPLGGESSKIVAPHRVCKRTAAVATRHSTLFVAWLRCASIVFFDRCSRNAAISPSSRLFRPSLKPCWLLVCLNLSPSSSQMVLFSSRIFRVEDGNKPADISCVWGTLLYLPFPFWFESELSLIAFRCNPVSKFKEVQERLRPLVGGGLFNYSAKSLGMEVGDRLACFSVAVCRREAECMLYGRLVLPAPCSFEKYSSFQQELSKLE